VKSRKDVRLEVIKFKFYIKSPFIPQNRQNLAQNRTSFSRLKTLNNGDAQE